MESGREACQQWVAGAVGRGGGTGGAAGRRQPPQPAATSDFAMHRLSS